MGRRPSCLDVGGVGDGLSSGPATVMIGQQSTRPVHPDVVSVVRWTPICAKRAG
jgi:hypothetical protein